MLLSEEQRCFDGLLEHLQESSKGEKMQDCMSQLEDAMDLIDQVIDSLEEAAL